MACPRILSINILSLMGLEKLHYLTDVLTFNFFQYLIRGERFIKFRMEEDRSIL